MTLPGRERDSSVQGFSLTITSSKSAGVSNVYPSSKPAGFQTVHAHPRQSWAWAVVRPYHCSPRHRNGPLVYPQRPITCGGFEVLIKNRAIVSPSPHSAALLSLRQIEHGVRRKEVERTNLEVVPHGRHHRPILRARYVVETKRVPTD